MSSGAGGDEHRRVADDILDFRLGALEKRVDEGFAHLDQRLDSLAYVRTETWIEREAARDAAYRNLRDQVLAEVAESKRIGVWALGLVVSLVLTSMVGFLVWIAQGGAG